MQKRKDTYFGSLKLGFSSLAEGLQLTFKHFRAATKKRKPIGIEDENYFQQENGIVTTEYPYEAIPVPDNGRYRLNNEIDDCIVCDLCAKICPVNCIDIVPIKSTEEIGKTSDGTTKRIYAATFDIDMAKCCYCGLCTTVCPTECLTMTKTYDYSEFDVRNMNYHFTDLSPEVAEEKKALFEQAEKEKQRLKAEAASQKTTTTADEKPVEKKPAFKPVIKTAPKVEDTTSDLKEEEKKNVLEESPEVKPKPVFKPVIKPAVPKVENKAEDDSNAEKKEEPPVAKPKPVFKPIIKPPKKDDQNP